MRKREQATQIIHGITGWTYVNCERKELYKQHTVNHYNYVVMEFQPKIMKTSTNNTGNEQISKFLDINLLPMFQC